MAVGLVALQCVLAYVLFWAILTVGYQVGGISGYDEMHRLGNGPVVALGAVLVPLLLGAPLTLLLLFTRFRRKAWIVPLGGMAVSITVWLLAISSFAPPSPVIGG